jgi:hypothetical protein
MLGKEGGWEGGSLSMVRLNSCFEMNFPNRFLAVGLTVTLLNIHESKRFKKGAFKFWGCLPVYQAGAATNAGASIL